MLDFIKGKAVVVKPDRIVIDIGGIGFSIKIPLKLSSQIKKDENVLLYTYMSLKEESIELYGFLDPHEKELFMELIKISGIGPRIAVNILSTYDRETLKNIIEQEDVRALSRVPAVGKKTAQRILLELKGVLPSLTHFKDQKFEDILSALINLGYRKNDAKESLEKIYSKDKDEATLIKESLTLLSGKHGE